MTADKCRLSRNKDVDIAMRLHKHIEQKIAFSISITGNTTKKEQDYYTISTHIRSLTPMLQLGGG